MKYVHFALVALLVSCHAPTAVQILPLEESTREPVAAPSVPLTLASLASVVHAAPRRPQAAPSAVVALCCDEPTGLCWSASGGSCESVSSIPRDCPVLAVRPVADLPGVVVCAD